MEYRIAPRAAAVLPKPVLIDMRHMAEAVSLEDGTDIRVGASFPGQHAHDGTQRARRFTMGYTRDDLL